jgi:predicted DNA binding CopG/RHH family protein
MVGMRLASETVAALRRVAAEQGRPYSRVADELLRRGLGLTSGGPTKAA